MENINDFLLEINNNKKSKNSEQKNFNKNINLFTFIY